jgi:4-hydroxy-3-methylbut-2-enyl diphosphate reductase
MGIRNPQDFPIQFVNRYSDGFSLERDLVRFGVVNQTTMLASDTQAIADYLKKIVMQKFGLVESNAGEHFADTRDTLCYATNDNQTAVKHLLDTEADLAIVIGGRKSSNSSHLVELCEEKLPTYFIESEADLLSSNEIKAFNWRTHEEYIKEGYLPKNRPVRILITSGASCPDAIVESTIEKLGSFFEDAKQLSDVGAEWL